ncbi:hypothetical protein GSI_00439 [Ganoderma sinense ZZ0214-1]|uniref:Uncharacterized protein n=1 Tax=Ganoderma sinense ZZ0214-1 TaxID=1077348 RepID=A0A2G8SSL6_9APHY|nr:hypothetical protein GSI_00439 [Ganoderma sinense ZZ0214-1]
MFSPFEDRVVRDQCKVVFDAKERGKFVSSWDKTIEQRAGNWQIKREKERQSTYRPQLDFVAATCQYTVFLWDQIQNTKGEKGARQKLDPRIPYFDGKFYPPTYTSQKIRNVSRDVAPNIACLKPVTVLHPAYIEELNFCPRCNATGDDLKWKGWTTSGPRDVHGVSSEEQVIGVQMRCKRCKAERGKADTPDDEEDDAYCWGTASSQFWERKEHWEIPLGVPHMKWRSAVTSELYDLIVEFRPDTTSAGLAEHIKRKSTDLSRSELGLTQTQELHLLQYHKRRREYLLNFEARTKQQVWPGGGQDVKLRKFPEPRTGRHKEGYDNTSISDELITDIYLSWVRATRQGESEESLRTKTGTSKLGSTLTVEWGLTAPSALIRVPGVALSIDATFRTASKATVVDRGKTHTRVYKGGITSVVNEQSIILAWRFCFTQGNWELVELLKGVKRRLELLGVSEPEMVISDCCCHVAKAIHDVFPDAVVCLDVWHFLMRYLVCLVGGSKCPVRQAVAIDIVDAILKSRALPNSPAIYWSKEEQVARLEAAFEKWEAKGVWTAAAAKTHEEQLTHVRKGCLARPRDDVRADGSRIEGTHKGWNSLQRSFSSGLEMMAALGHDHVLRHNTRVESALKEPPKFIRSTFGSHHVHLVNDCARRWNKQLARKSRIDSDMEPLPVLEAPSSGETFGMIKMSSETAAHQSLTSIKKESVDDEELLDLSSQDLLDANYILSGVGVDPSLLYQLPPKPSGPIASVSTPTPHPCPLPHGAAGGDASLMSPPSPPPPPPLSQSAVHGAFAPGPAASSFQEPLAPQSSSAGPMDLDTDPLYDPESREQKAGIIEAASKTSDDGESVSSTQKRGDRKGKAVDRSACQSTSNRKRHAETSANTADDVIEISDDEGTQSQSKPPPRKKLRLYVPGMPAAAKANSAAATSSTSSAGTPSINPSSVRACCSPFAPTLH